MWDRYGAGPSSNWILDDGDGSNGSDIIEDMVNLHYQVDSTIGDGSYGSVRPAVYREQSVAVKVYKKDVPESIIQREINIMKLMRGEYHFVQFLGRFEASTPTGRHGTTQHCIVMELAYNMSLKALLESAGGYLSQGLKVAITRDLCRSLQCLHDKGIAHEDVKSDNVLLDFGLRAKLCDFGTARYDSEEFSERLGTVAYMSPEKKAARLGCAYDRIRSDIYSLGMVIERILGRLPIVQKCLAQNPEDRPATCIEVLDALPRLGNGHNDLDSFKGVAEHSLGEAERLNLAYYWTDTFMGPDEDDVESGRKLFYQGQYEQALEVLTKSHGMVAKLFLGVMNLHGYGCQRNWNAAIELFNDCQTEMEPESNILMSSLVDYYLAMIQTRQGNTDAIRSLSELASRGNAYAQVELANFFALRSGRLTDECFEFAPLVNGNHKNVLDLLYRAAKTGYPHAQALLTLFFITSNPQRSRSIPVKEMEFLRRSVEGGSATGNLLLQFIEETLDKTNLLKTSKNAALLEFIGDLLKLTNERTQAVGFYSAAASLGHLSSLWAMGKCLKSQAEMVLGSEFKEGAMVAINDVCSILVTLLSKGFNSVDDTDLYFFRLERHKTTVEYDLVDGLMKLGKEEVAMTMAKRSNDTSFKAMRALFNTCIKERGSSNNRKWQQILAEKRHHMRPDVIARIGALYHTLPDEENALEWFEAAARAGYVEAVCMLAMLYRKRGRKDVSMCLWKAGVDQGNDTAMLQLAVGGGVDKELKVRLLERSVELNNPLAMVELATMLRWQGELFQAEKLLKQALIYGLDTAASHLVFLLVDRDGRYGQEAKYWFQRSIKSIHPQVLYEVGVGFEDKRSDELIELVSKSADKLDASGLFNMGMLVASRHGVSLKSYRFFALAAEKKFHLHAAFICLRYCYVMGDLEGVEKWKKLLAPRGVKGIEESMKRAMEWKNTRIYM